MSIALARLEATEVKHSLNLFAIEVIFVSWCPSIRNIFGWTDLDFNLLKIFFNVSHVFLISHIFQIV